MTCLDFLIHSVDVFYTQYGIFIHDIFSNTALPNLFFREINNIYWQNIIDENYVALKKMNSTKRFITSVLYWTVKL